MHVLIAEGLEPVRIRLVMLVREQPGIRAIESTVDLEATVEGIRREKWELVILGSRLADGTGFDVLRNVNGQMRNTSVILLCPQLDGEYLYNGHALGADFVLESPRDVELIPSLIRKLNAGRRRKQQGQIHVG